MSRQDQAKAMDHFDERLGGLQKRSLEVLPLKYRRETPQKLLPIEALCEYEANEVQAFGYLTFCMRLRAPLIPVMSKHRENSKNSCFRIPHLMYLNP